MKIKIFENCFFNFFPKITWVTTKPIGNYCLDTRRLPNKTNRNVLASKLRPVKSFKKSQKFQKKKNTKTMHRRKFFPKIKCVFFLPFSTLYKISEL